MSTRSRSRSCSDCEFVSFAPLRGGRGVEALTRVSGRLAAGRSVFAEPALGARSPRAPCFSGPSRGSPARAHCRARGPTGQVGVQAGVEVEPGIVSLRTGESSGSKLRRRGPPWGEEIFDVPTRGSAPCRSNNPCRALRPLSVRPWDAFECPALPRSFKVCSFVMLRCIL